MGEDLFWRALDYANRPNPYPIYAQLRETPVSRQEDGSYVVSTYREIVALLHDPRISSDERNRTQGATVPVSDAYEQERGNPPFLFLDPPEHDRLRRIVMRHFGPPARPGLVESVRPRVRQLVDRLLDAQQHQTRLDLVDDLAYPLPVTVICELLGVPPEDEALFHAWSETLASTLDPDPGTNTPEHQQRVAVAAQQLAQYMVELVTDLSLHPRDNLLSGLAADPDPAGRMDPQNLISTAILLLVAGHETTVNLITNGMLTLLRHPEVLEQVRSEPELMISTVEEVLRYDPPVQFRQRTTLSEISYGGVTIPKGAAIFLVLASGNRDPSRFKDPDRFDPDREDNQHLGFGSGIHYCLGAPLARLEAQVALTELVRRLASPRLVVDPPPYRENPALRGPRHLLVDFERMRK